MSETNKDAVCGHPRQDIIGTVDAPQAILAVTMPVGAFLATTLTLVVRRYFRKIDREEKRAQEKDAKLVARLDEFRPLLTEILTELRAQGGTRTGELAAKIDDHRVSEVRREVSGLSALVRERLPSTPDAVPAPAPPSTRRLPRRSEAGEAPPGDRPPNGRER
jgi:hypothetical protein